MKFDKNTVSVVISFKGRENLSALKKCIDSLIWQTQLPIEFIIVGARYDLDDFKIRLENRLKKYFFEGDKNEAKNVGIRKAKGEYILYVDHDMVAEKNLIENCLLLTSRFDALIIPERIYGTGFWQRCRDLEKRLLIYDSVATAPRFYRKSIFTSYEKPFDIRFGLLDEWGFNYNIRQKKIKIGFSDSFVTIHDFRFSLLKHLKYRFKMGFWIDNFSKIDNVASHQRTDLISRGLLFYGAKLRYFIWDPTLFSGLIFLKFLELIAFSTGRLFVKTKDIINTVKI